MSHRHPFSSKWQARKKRACSGPVLAWTVLCCLTWDPSKVEQLTPEIRMRSNNGGLFSICEIQIFPDQDGRSLTHSERLNGTADTSRCIPSTILVTCRVALCLCFTFAHISITFDCSHLSHHIWGNLRGSRSPLSLLHRFRQTRIPSWYQYSKSWVYIQMKRKSICNLPNGTFKDRMRCGDFLESVHFFN